MEEFLLYKKKKEKTLKGQPFAERKDGRGSDRISEDQAPYNKKLKIGKPRLKEDQTPTGEAQGTTREKKVCDLEHERRGTEETWVDPHDWKLQTQRERELANNKFSRTNDEGSDDLRLKNQSVTRQKKGVTNRGVVYNEVRDKHRGSTFSHLHWNDDTEQENIERDPQLKDLSQSCPGDDDEADVQMQGEIAYIQF